MTPVNIPASGFTPEAMANAIGQRQRDYPTVIPATRSVKKFFAV